MSAAFSIAGPRRSMIESQLHAFLARAGLTNRPYSLREYMAGTRRAGYRVTFQAMVPSKILKAATIVTGGRICVFYPDVDDLLFTLHCVSHEIGHLVLEHSLRTQHQANGESFCTAVEEAEAEYFATVTVALRTTTSVKCASDPAFTPLFRQFWLAD